MDDSEPNNKNVLQKKERKQEGHPVQQRHGIKTSFPFYMIYVTSRVMNKHSNIVRLNIGGHHNTFNSSIYCIPNPRYSYNSTKAGVKQ